MNSVRRRLCLIEWGKFSQIEPDWIYLTTTELEKLIPGATIALGILWYKQGGIDALLFVKTGPVKSALIPETLMNQLRECLSQPQGFNSYGQIQEWLTQECQVVVAYKTVHKIVPAQAECQIESTPST